MPKKLKADEEQDFQKWYKGWATKAGIKSGPDHPEQKYDYRAAYKAGVEPTISKEDGRYHWPSRFKDLDHPNRFVRNPSGVLIDTISGDPVDKEASGKKDRISSMIKSFKNNPKTKNNPKRKYIEG